MVIEVKGFMYIGETLFKPGGTLPLFRFVRLDGVTEVEKSDCYDSPTPAFVQIARNVENGRSEPRPNGKLYMGVHYCAPQEALRAHFKKFPPKIPEDARRDYENWMKTPTKLDTTSKSHFPPVPLPISTKPTPTIDNMPFRPPSADRRMGKKRSSDDSLVRSLQDLDMNAPFSPSSSKQLKVINDAAKKANLQVQKGPLYDDAFLPPLERNNSMQQAMKFLRGDSLDTFLEDDIFSRLDNRKSINMTASDLFNVLKHPSSEYISRQEMHRTISTLLQMQVPKAIVDQTFDACDRDHSGKVTLENFVRMIEEREADLRLQFRRIDTDKSGEITLDELRQAKRKGLFVAQEREINALLEAMDRVSDGFDDVNASDRKIQWHEFRALMILLPPATTIQTIIDIMKDSLAEKDLIERVNEEPLNLQDFNLAQTNINSNEDEEARITPALDFLEEYLEKPIDFDEMSS